MEKHFELVNLLDTYGMLLTEKQNEILNYYYNEDMSLGEIAGVVHSSRQGVYDILHRSEGILYDYEKKLSLVKKSAAARKIIDALDKTVDESIKAELEKLKELY